jgi:hypothetical protein
VVLVYVRLSLTLTRRQRPPHHMANQPPPLGRQIWEMLNLQWSLISRTIDPSRKIAIPISLLLAVTMKSFRGADLAQSVS